MGNWLHFKVILPISADSTPKLAGQNPGSVSQEVIYHGTLAEQWGRDFLKIPSLWEAALETKRRCFSKINLESNVTPNITRSSAFSTVPPIVSASDWGCIVRDLETIIILVLLAFNFIPQRSHHSLTLPRSRIQLYCQYSICCVAALLLLSISDLQCSSLAAIVNIRLVVQQPCCNCQYPTCSAAALLLLSISNL